MELSGSLTLHKTGSNDGTQLSRNVVVLLASL